jgi:hypothetical protein
LYVFSLLLTIPLTYLCYILSRAHGGQEIEGKVGEIIDNLSLEAFLLSLPLIPICLLAIPFGWWSLLAIPAYAASVFMIRTGHGQYMDMGTWKKIIKPERIDFLVEIFFGPDPNEFEEGKGNYWRDFFGLSLQGFLGVLPTSIILICFGNIFACIPLLICGTLKGVAYALSKNITIDTEKAEGLRGIFLGLGYGLTIALLLIGIK